MRKIKIKKVAVAQEGLPPIPAEKHVPGTWQSENYSLPVEYTVEGVLILPIEMGRSVLMDREKRNDVVVSGFFQTSVVTEVGEDWFKTKNSVYTVEYLN